MMSSLVRVLMIGSLSMTLLIGVNGCASSGSSGDSAAEASPAEATSAPVPASSKLARVKVGMNDVEVRKAIGEPDNLTNYMTGKAWIPFYFGGDTHRTEWIYTGVGRVVFSRNRWSGGLTVIELIHNPSEQG